MLLPADSFGAPAAEGDTARPRAIDPLVVAYDHYTKGLWAKAIEAYQEILKKAPGNVKALYHLARSHVAVGEYDKALKLLESNDEDTAIAAYTGQLMVAVGRYRDAEGLLTAILDLEPGNLRALYNLGRLHQTRGNKKKAEKYLLRTIRRAAAVKPPTYQSEGFAGLASVALGYKKSSRIDYFRKAKAHLSRSVRKNPRDFEFYTAFGQMFQDKDNPADARKIFEEILVKNDNWADAHVGLAASLAGSGRFDKAMKHVDRALAINPRHPGAHALRAVAGLYKNDPEGARRQLEMALKVNPNEIDLLAIQAAMYLLDDDVEHFDEVEKKVLTINPKPSNFYKGVARVAQNKFRFDRAIQYSRKAILLDPENWGAYAVLGLNLMRTGNEKEARQILEAQHKGDGYNTVVYNMLELSDHLKDNFVTTTTEHFILRVHKTEHEVVTPYAIALLEEAYGQLTRKYDFVPAGPILVEVFKSHRYFAARTTGLPGLFALGACFGKVITLDSPSVMGGRANWGVVLWHEFAHVITVQQSNWRVPRWLTEGLSEHEQKQPYPEWDRDQDIPFLHALLRNDLVSVGELDDAFQGTAQRIVASYFQSSQIVDFIVDRWGFETIPAILKQFAAGKKLKEVLKTSTGLSIPEFDVRFRTWALKRYAGYKVLPPYQKEDLERLEAELKAHPNDANRMVKLATAQLNSGEPDKAEAHALSALKADPKNADPHVILGQVFARRRQSAKAMEQFQAAIAGNSADLFTPHSQLAKHYERTGDIAKAIEHYEEAVRNFPRLVGRGGRPVLLITLAKLYERTGKREAYINTLERIITISEKDVATRMKLAGHYRAQGDAKKRIEVLSQINFIVPFAMRHHEPLGDLLLANGDARRAAVEFKVALALKAGLAETLYVKLARAYMQQPDKNAALETLAKALKENANNVEARQLLAKVKAMPDPVAVDKPNARRRLAEALRTWKRYQKAHATRDFWSSTGYKPTDAQKAAIEPGLKITVEAIVALARKSAQLNPENSGPFELIAAVLVHARKHPEAARAARKALSLNPDFADGHLLLARGYHTEAMKKKADKDKPGARASLTEAVGELKVWLAAEPLSPHAAQELLALTRWEKELADLR